MPAAPPSRHRTQLETGVSQVYAPAEASAADEADVLAGKKRRAAALATARASTQISSETRTYTKSSNSSAGPSRSIIAMPPRKRGPYGARRPSHPAESSSDEK